MKPRIIMHNNNIMPTIIHTALFYFIPLQILDSNCTPSRLEYEYLCISNKVLFSSYYK